ncbi:MAG: LamG domain-containing protein, partial [Planctomycetota bacterium]
VANQLPQSWGTEPESVVSASFTLVSDGGMVVVTFDQNQGSHIEEPTWDEVFLNGFVIDVAVSPTNALNPDPAHEATDVPRDVALSWTPGEFASQHDVYFGTSFDDVNNATSLDTMGPDNLYRARQEAASYAVPERLDFGQIYYWRVDEVNAPPDSTIFKGDLWSFTVEPVGYPIAGENITVIASSFNKIEEGPENTINGSGLDDNDLHSDDSKATWLSSMIGPQPTWIQYEFDRVYKLHQMWVWNHNSSVELVVGFGIKEATIEYSVDGINWTTLGTTHQFARAPGAAGYAANTTIDLSGEVAKYVKITANSNWGGIVPQYGLSEVRFLYIPVIAREPNPGSGATDVDVEVVLSWSAGREAAEHNVYISSDEQAVADGTAPVTTVPETSYGPLSLDLGQTYYWKVSEVNTAESPTTWDGDVWNFATPEFLVVDDFENYNDLDPDDPNSNRIFNAWVDGYEQPANGSVVGYPAAPFAEQDIVHNGAQSMPLLYDNTGTARYSEAELTLSPPQDWTKHGVNALSLWFSGDPNNVPDQMYVKINGSKVTYDSDADNLTRIPWQPWNIDLASLGIDVQNVTKFSIGFGDETSMVPGGSGKVFFDDIRLYPYSRQLATPTEPAPGNLVAHWQFEGNANDSSGNGLHGTIMGAPTFVAGKVGQAISLRGVNDFVEITGYKGILGPNAATVTAWINTAATGTGAIVGWGSNVAGQRFGFRVNAGRLRMEHHGGNVQGDTSMNDGQWHHVVVAVQASATISYPDVILYVDGVDDTRASTDPDAFNLTADQDVSIGRRPASDDRYFIGLLDDVRIYNRALTQEEIAWLAGRTKPFDKPF